MKQAELLSLQEQSANLNTIELIHWASQKWQLLLANSTSAEDQVLWDLLWHNYQIHGGNKPCLFSLDTGRLPQETYDCIEKTEIYYGIQVELIFPIAEDLTHLLRQGGPNLFYHNHLKRKSCCRIRKIEPLRRRLQQHINKYGQQAIWLTGQRRSQSITRKDLNHLEWDEQFGLLKLNPMADWQRKDIWDYIHKNNIPYNFLQNQGYLSIGCAPCTRAVAPGEDERSGRWWWEAPQQKECGIHITKDGSVQKI